jgi:hypothetical protein
MAWLMRGRGKRKKLRTKQLKKRKNAALYKDTAFDFDLQSTLASHLGGGVIMSFLRQLSERTCFLRGRVLAQHDNGAV